MHVLSILLSCVNNALYGYASVTFVMLLIHHLIEYL